MAKSVGLFLNILLNWKAYSQEWSTCIMAWINRKVDHEYLAIHKHYQCKHKVCVSSWTRSQKWEHRVSNHATMHMGLTFSICIAVAKQKVPLQAHYFSRRYILKVYAREISNVPIRQTKTRSSKPSKNTTYILYWKLWLALRSLESLNDDYSMTMDLH